MIIRILSLKHLVYTYWKTDELPERLHYGTNARTLDFVIEAKKI
jgi:hypothetical protein